MSQMEKNKKREVGGNEEKMLLSDYLLCTSGEVGVSQGATREALSWLINSV